MANNGQKKLIKLMEYKAECLARETGIDPEQYFNDMDREAINAIPEKRAAKLATHLARRIQAWKGTGKTPSDLASLPFCWIYKCDGCPYGETHGKCHEDAPNDYDLIRDMLQQKYEKEVVLLNAVCKTQTMLNILKFGVRA